MQQCNGVGRQNETVPHGRQSHERTSIYVPSHPAAEKRIGIGESIESQAGNEISISKPYENLVGI